MRHYFSFIFSSLSKSTLWSDQFIEKPFFISFEALSKQHV